MQQLSNSNPLEFLIDRNPLTATSGTPLKAAIKLMAGGDRTQAKASSDCILVIENRRLLGMLTDQDVVRLVAADRPLDSLVLAEVMTRPVITAQIDCLQTELAFQAESVLFDRLQQQQIRHLPIVDFQNCLVGLISSDRLCRWLQQQSKEQQRWYIEFETERVALQTSESTKQALLRAIPDLMIRMTADGTYLDFLPAKDFKVLIPQPDMQGENLFDIMPAAIATERMHYIQQALATGETQIYEYELTIDGEIHYQEGRITVSGENEVLLIVRDITQAKQAEADLRASESRFRSLVANIPGAVYRCRSNPEWVEEFLSDAAEEISGYPITDFINKQVRSWASLMHPDDRQLMQKLIDRAIADRQPFVLEYRIIHRNGSIRWVYEKGQAVFDQTDNLLYFDGAIFDISEAKSEEAKRICAEAALQKANEELELRVQERTAALEQLNQQLQQEIAERKRIEAQNALLATAIDHAGDAIQISDADAVLEYVNPATEALTGYTRAEMIGKTPAMLFRSEHHDQAFYEAIETTLKSGQVWRGHLVARSKNGLCHDQEATISPVCDAEGQMTHYVAVRRDITERKRTERFLWMTQFAINHTADAAFWIRSDGRLIYSNQAAWRSLNYSASELMHLSIWDIEIDIDNQSWVQRWQTLEQWSSLNYESHHHAKEGQCFPVEVSINYLEFDGAKYGFALARDITDRKRNEIVRKRAEAALRESEFKLRMIIENSIDGISLKDTEGRYLLINPACAKFLGHPVEAILGRRDSELLSKNVAQTFQVSDQEVINRGNTQTYEETINFNGISYTFLSTKAPYLSPEGEVLGIIGIYRDITDRKQAESIIQQSEARFRHIVDSNMIGIFFSNKDGQITEANDAFLSLVGYSRDELRWGQMNWQNMTPPERMVKAKKVAEELQMFGISGTFEKEYLHKNGDRIPVLVGVALMGDVAATTGYDVTFVLDITGRKLIEEQLKASLDEKDLLLREVHHRVKNNLQVISSIFSLQAHYLQDPAALSILAECQNRISSMALIHEKLYQSDRVAKIDFADYIKSLTSNLFSTYNISPNLVCLDLQIANVNLNLDTAITCGLLINELVSNSLKHAFPQQRSGKVSLQFTIDPEQQFRLVVQDDGIGLPEDLDIQSARSLGLRLIKALTRQLEGKLKITDQQGAIFQVTFPQPRDRWQS
jgi:PAS domain S-box-containing protein